jgi:hypothetical protein
MEMITPVLTVSGSGGAPKGNRMQFPMDKPLDLLPPPRSPGKVTPKEEQGAVGAVLRFGGFPLDAQVQGAVRRLRERVQRDGFKYEPGFRLARYNEPLIPPFLRRNEVLIKLKDFEMPPV